MSRAEPTGDAQDPTPVGSAGPAQEPILTRRNLLGGASALLALEVLRVRLGERFLTRVSAMEDLERAQAQKDLVPQLAFVIDLRLCDGCGDCTEGCQIAHHLPKSDEWIKVYELTATSGQTFFMPVLCQLCQNPPCVRVCPVGATFSDESGVVLIDQDICIGCRICMAACPYGVRIFNWDDPAEVPEEFYSDSPGFTVPQTRGTVSKCDGCLHLLRENKFPACVDACRMEAIYVGDLVEDVASNGHSTVVLSQFLRENDAFRFKEEAGTEPRVYYIAGHGQDWDF